MSYRVIAVNDDESHCQCCGRTNLKRVVWCEEIETGELHHFGTVCATLPGKGLPAEQVKGAIRRFKNEQSSIRQLAHSAYKKAGGKYSFRNGSFKADSQDLLNKCFDQVAEKRRVLIKK